ncbi:Cytochrome b-c1 complex subunit 7 [Trichoplax sp. H2]|uniref:Cytochrome b-c1 complex subunit 7 n=1 Tax=Trichoplax adhaerens TaxID=10228 RepID=B3RYH5_TRIAD|nr:expressed hypothetical protein [Trichoplax adhaerens]EDV25041.1 expressed hypothetical protein [Trichoplax adhaerens]RDD45910.1 Cytochrome b-c1 complex subunit 7 [Trichoplax sp. H2]|eukprot:XP_002112931.1 expressed hypothetical protein [Trichoplax adhaerens]
MANKVVKGAEIARQLPLSRRIFAAVAEWWQNASGYRKYGLKREDLLNDEIPNIAEALRRLPEDEYMARQWRIKRALDCSLKNTYLPREEWTKVEDDKFYLKPYLDLVEKEKTERKSFDNQ